MTDHLLDRLVAAVGAQYLVDAEIGRGGMAVVYRATDVRLNRRVAIKLLPPELAFNADVRERFLREAQTSAQLTHPHIVPIYTVDEREGMVYFVMALVDGESLAQRLAREPQLPDRRRTTHPGRRGRRAVLREQSRRRPSRREAGQHHARARAPVAPSSRTSASRAPPRETRVSR